MILDVFLDWMPGVYNNKLQAYKSPFEFPMLQFDIEILPLLVDGLYCFKVSQTKLGQSNEPYRTGYFTANGLQNGSVILRNYEHINFESMEFLPYEDSIAELKYDPVGEYFEAAMKTYGLKKGNSLVSVQSYIKLSKNSLEVLDRGYDPVTEKLLWGLEHGPALLIKERN